MEKRQHIRLSPSVPHASDVDTKVFNLKSLLVNFDYMDDFESELAAQRFF